MSSAIETIRSMNLPVITTTGSQIRWTNDDQGNPCIVAGYGTNMAEKRSLAHYIILYRVSNGQSYYAIVKALGTYPVKYKHISVDAIKEFDPSIPDRSTKARTDYLTAHYLNYLGMASTGLVESDHDLASGRGQPCAQGPQYEEPEVNDNDDEDYEPEALAPSRTAQDALFTRYRRRYQHQYRTFRDRNGRFERRPQPFAY